MKLIKHFWFESLLTLSIWALVGWHMGVAVLLLVVILSILEITLSADNAVVNAKVLEKLSKFWQTMFLTVGILLAVFVVRFILPVLMVAVATGLGVGEVFDLALNNAEEYGHKLHEVAPLISGFGGMFLFMVALIYFTDPSRKPRDMWLRVIEQPLHKTPRTLKYVLIPAAVIALLYMAVEPSMRGGVLAGLLVGGGLYLLLHAITHFMEHLSVGTLGAKHTGWAAFVLFMYLQVLDASFSLDGVIGAFALTNNIVVIMLGLGIGAVWVRSFTLYMVRHHTLVKYRYLDAGAHYAIAALASVMFLKLLHIELPEVVVGSIGLLCIVAAVYSSIKSQKVLTK